MAPIVPRKFAKWGCRKKKADDYEIKFKSCAKTKLWDATELIYK
jgi:hypothetical protein